MKPWEDEARAEPRSEEHGDRVVLCLVVESLGSSPASAVAVALEASPDSTLVHREDLETDGPHGFGPPYAIPRRRPTVSGAQRSERRLLGGEFGHMLLVRRKCGSIQGRRTLVHATGIKNIKPAAHQLVDSLPDDATWDDIMYHVYVRQAIDAGLRDVDEGQLIDVAAVRRTFGLVE